MIIIIGTGLAGYQLAREFRKLDPLSPLMLITADAGHYYPKPQLSTALTSKKTAAMLPTADAEGMAKQLNASIRTHQKVTQVDPVNKTIHIGTELIPYSQLIFACGADVIKAPLKGDGAEEVFSINHLYHYTDFEKSIHGKKTIAILGAGLIGCEFANDLTNAGYVVHVIAPDKTPLERFVPSVIGLLLQKDLEQNGVTFHLSCVADTVSKSASGYTLTLSNGDTLSADFVLSAIGLKPHIELAQAAQVKTNRGIVVNRFLQTNVKDIYALGDCAEVEGHVLPFITPLLNSARALAKSLHGEPTAVEYPAMPVTVKTPAHPIVVCPPLPHIKGAWTIEAKDKSVKALFFDDNQVLQGFVLTQEAVKERMQLTKQLPPLF